ncbi:MAG TPA: hypothetical protein VIS96_17570 [Terrimicrobiaceae bacterium]
MFFCRAFTAAILISVAHAAETTPPPVTRTILMAAAADSATDNIGSGWCGRGMLSILKNAGLGKGLAGGNGQDWESILSRAGWKPIRCSSPQRAPLGSVLVYLGDARVGKYLRGTPGGNFGHVEMVALDRSGQRLYVSDNPRVAPGGTVLDNFTGRAWIPPGRRLWGTPAVGEDIDAVLRERKRMALEYFRRNGQQVAMLTPAIAQ